MIPLIGLLIIFVAIVLFLLVGSVKGIKCCVVSEMTLFMAIFETVLATIAIPFALLGKRPRWGNWHFTRCLRREAERLYKETSPFWLAK